MILLGVNTDSREVDVALVAVIRAELGRQHIPDARLAEALGLSRSSMSAWLSGDRPFRVQEVHQIAEFLGLAMGEVWDRQQDELARIRGN